MSLEDNNQNKLDLNEFLKSLQNNPKTPSQDIGGEGFPFSDEFDMDAFVSENNNPLEKTLTSIKLESAVSSSAPKEISEPETSAMQETAMEDADIFTDDAGDLKDDNFNFSFQTELKDQSIKHLEQKIAELESRYEDANKEKYFNVPQTGEDNPEKTEIRPKGNDEFFQNISTTIETLKGSLENIVSSRSYVGFSNLNSLKGSIDNIVNQRMQYEENLIREDQGLIVRLREKTSRLKSINISLNSEVKRAKNEKLEFLRKSAEQTKEILSVRMQLSKVEEKARHGDFKLSRLEQQLSVLNAEKGYLDEEIKKIRTDKLESLKKSAEQTKEIMSLRLELTKTEEKFRQEELQAGYLKEQLKTMEGQRDSLDSELYATRSEREEANAKSARLSTDIEALKSEITLTQERLKKEAETAGSLREKILSLETELQRLHSEKAALILKTDENLRQIEAMRAEHEREIANLKASQIQEVELLKSQKMLESQTITLELRRAEDKYRQEETFVNTLKLQIESLQNDVKNLDSQRTELHGKSTDLAREMEFIKEGHTREIESLQRELTSAEEKFAREEKSYNALFQQFQAIEKEKADLNEEIKKIISARDEALKQNADYVAQIETIKSEHLSVLETLKSDLAKMQDKHNQDTVAYNALKQQSEASISQLNTDKENITAASAIEKSGLISQMEEIRTVSARDIAALKAEITRGKAQYQADLDGLKNATQSERDALLSAANREKDGLLAQIEQIKYSSARDIEALKAEFNRGKDQYLYEIENLKSDSARLKERGEAEKAALISELIRNKEEGQSRLAGINAELERSKADAGNKLSGLNAELERSREDAQNKLAAINAELQRAREDAQNKFSGLNSELARSKEESDLKLSAINAEFAKYREQSQADINSLNAEFNSQKDQLRSDLENTKNINARDRERLLADFEQFKHSSEDQKQQYLADISSLKEANSRETKKLLAEIEVLKKANAEEMHTLQLVSSKEFEEYVKDSSAKAHAASLSLFKAEATLRENENIISMLRGEVASLDNEKLLIDGELKKANAERCDILAQLEEKSKELDAFHRKYEQEILILRDEKAKEASSYESKLNTVSERLAKEESNVSTLKQQISTLEQEKTVLSGNVDSVKAEASSNAKKINAQTDEIIALKSQLTKAESRFLQDTVLITQLKEQFSSTQGTQNILDNEIQQLREENAAAQKDMAEKETEIRTLKSVLLKTEEQLKEEEIAVKHLQEHTSKLKAVNFALDREVKKAQAEKLDALRKSAEQAKEILMLREQLSAVGSGFKTLDFENGIISIRKEYEAKVEKLEGELKDASAMCAAQVKEIQDLKTDNSRLKNAEQEKIKIESEYNMLTEKVSALESQLAQFRGKDDASSTLAKAKAAALSAQISKINKEKSELENRMSGMQQQIAQLNANEKQASTAFNTLKERISGNDAVIEKLKQEIIVLTAENKDLKSSAEVNTRRQQVLEAKIEEVSEEKKKMEDTFRTKTSVKLTHVEIKAEPSRTAGVQPAVKAVAVPQTDKTKTDLKAKTQVAKEQTEEELQLSLLDFPEPTESIEVVDLESQGMDLSMIFDEPSADEAPSQRGSMTSPSVQTVRGTAIRPMTLKTGPIPSADGPYDEMDVTDHSPRNHGVVRKVGRAPNSYRENEAYSDFLKKTKSMFFRIKWSLFKE